MSRLAGEDAGVLGGIVALGLLLLFARAADTNDT
jgi:hypothetical protein